VDAGRAVVSLLRPWRSGPRQSAPPSRPGHGRLPGSGPSDDPGWCPSPARDPDQGHRRHPDRPGRGSRRSPSAPRSAIGFAVRMTDPVRHTATDEDAKAWPSRMTLSAAYECAQGCAYRARAPRNTLNGPQARSPAGPTHGRWATHVWASPRSYSEITQGCLESPDAVYV